MFYLTTHSTHFILRLYLILDPRFDVCLEDLRDALGGLHWHGALLDDDLRALRHAGDHASRGLDVLEVGSSPLRGGKTRFLSVLVGGIFYRMRRENVLCSASSHHLLNKLLLS